MNRRGGSGGGGQHSLQRPAMVDRRNSQPGLIASRCRHDAARWGTPAEAADFLCPNPVTLQQRTHSAWGVTAGNTIVAEAAVAAARRTARARTFIARLAAGELGQDAMLVQLLAVG